MPAFRTEVTHQPNKNIDISHFELFSRMSSQRGTEFTIKCSVLINMSIRDATTMSYLLLQLLGTPCKEAREEKKNINTKKSHIDLTRQI